MKIVVFGLAVSSSWGNGHATLWRALGRALGRRGHSLVFFERDTTYYAAHRDGTEFSGISLQVYPSWDEVRARAAAELASADVGMVTSFCPDGVAATDLVADSRAPLRAFYDLDTPVTLALLDAGEAVPAIGSRGLADFDLVLSYTGGASLGALQRCLGARRTAPLYGSVDPATHSPGTPCDAFRADLSYLGTYAADRQHGVERLLLEPARRRPDLTMLIAGAQYPADFPWTSNTKFVRHLPPADHPGLFASSMATLNVTRGVMAAVGYCPSGRLFEAAACGAAVLSDRWEGIERFFTPGDEIVLVDGPDEVLAALALGPDALGAIGRQARERALAEHTAAARAAELEVLLERALRPDARPPPRAALPIEPAGVSAVGGSS